MSATCCWRKCTRPKKKGGLGLINLRSQNMALPIKHLEIFYNKIDTHWVNLIWNTYYSNGKVPPTSKKMISFWWRDILKLGEMFRGIVTCTVGNGTLVMFWSYVWNEHYRCFLHQQDIGWSRSRIPILRWSCEL
jgi:hypothetical protein